MTRGCRRRVFQKHSSTPRSASEAFWPPDRSVTVAERMAVSLKVGGAFQHFAVQIEKQKQQIQALETSLDAANRENARLQIECGPSARQALLDEVLSQLSFPGLKLVLTRLHERRCWPVLLPRRNFYIVCHCAQVERARSEAELEREAHRECQERLEAAERAINDEHKRQKCA